MADRVEQAARHEAMFREVHEHIARLTALTSEIGYCLIICECGDTSCAESLEITADEYEAVRAQGTHFAVVPGHQLEGIERVVDGNGRFLVVEKFGDAAAIADADNPRRPVTSE